VLREMNISTFNVREMMWIYALVGAFTKNFVFRNQFFTEFGKPFSRSGVMYDGLTYKAIPSLFKYTPYSEWIYSYHAWRQMPNVLNPRSVDDDFCSHYLKHLTHFYKRYTTANVLEIEASVRDYATHLALEALQGNVSTELADLITGKQMPDIGDTENYVNHLLGDV
jgi:hypothetical protein